MRFCHQPSAPRKRDSGALYPLTQKDQTPAHQSAGKGNHLSAIWTTAVSSGLLISPVAIIVERDKMGGTG